MYPYYRRQYISKNPEKNTENPPPESTENNNYSDLKLFTTESIKLLSEDSNETKISIKKLEDRLTDLAIKISNLENHIDLEEKQKRLHTLPQYNTITNEHDTPKHNIPYNQHPYPSEKNSNVPLMPGSGFSNVTADYLRNLNNTNKV